MSGMYETLRAERIGSARNAIAEESCLPREECIPKPERTKIKF